MKKIILLPLLSALVLNASATNSNNKTELNDLRNEINLLKQEIEGLKTTHEENSNELEEISDFTEEIEANSLKDKINFGLGFKTNLDNFSKKFADGKNINNENIWSNKLMLNMKADISDNMNFYGRLSMYKYWGSSSIHPYTYYDNMQGRVPADSAIYVERAYLNWFFYKDSAYPMALTIGRQPSSDGPSNQFKDNTVRKGTYSALLYDGAADGVVLTTNISKLLHNEQSYLRIGYSKGFGYSESSPEVGNAFIGASNNDIEDTNVVGVFLDTSVPSIKNSLIQVSYSHMFDIVANPLDTNSTDNNNPNIGSLDLVGAMVEFTNLKNSHLDLFAQFGLSIAHPNGKGYKPYKNVGLLSSAGDQSDKRGYSTWVGGRYGFGEKQKYKIGVEYNYGSQNWINLTQGSFDVYNKLATRGNAYESYLMYVINRYANIRLGYVFIDYNYTRSGWFVGASKKISSLSDPRETANTVEKLQSIYLKMSLNF